MDPKQLDCWIVKAATATSVADVLAAEALVRPRMRTRTTKTTNPAPRAKRRLKRA